MDKQTALALAPDFALDRRRYIGSSDIAAILGISPWKTPLEVWLEKTSPEPLPDNDSTVKRRGRRAEPYIIEWLQEERDFWIVDRNVRVTHPEHSFLAAESDFTYIVDPDKTVPVGTSLRDDGTEIDLDGNVGHGEAKSVGEFADWSKWGEEGSQEVPDYYIAQALFALECNGMPETTIAGGFGWDKVRTYRFKRDLELGAAIVRKAVDFWNDYVLASIPPPTVTSEDSLRLLKRLGSFDWQASAEAIAAAEVVVSTQAELKALEARLGAEKKTFLDLLITAAEVHGVAGEDLKKVRVLGSDQKPMATLTEISKKGHVVGPSKYVQLRFAKEKA